MYQAYIKFFFQGCSKNMYNYFLKDYVVCYIIEMY